MRPEPPYDQPKKSKLQNLDLIIPKERKIRSIVGGLETSLGTTLWEPLAKSLATANGFKVIDDNLQCPSNMPASLSNEIQIILDDRNNVGSRLNAQSSHDKIKDICQSFISRPISEFGYPPRGKGVDIWLVKDGVNYFFDTKTVQPNLKDFAGFLDQILNWYAYYYSQYPTGTAVARIVFPYNPSSGSFWAGATGGGAPLEPTNEGWVENEFWDFCSGHVNTYGIIKDAFSELHASNELEETFDRLLS